MGVLGYNFEMSPGTLSHTLIFPGAVAGLALCFLSPVAVASSAAGQVVALSNQERLRSEMRENRWQNRAEEMVSLGTNAEK